MNKNIVTGMEKLDLNGVTIDRTEELVTNMMKKVRQRYNESIEDIEEYDIIEELLISELTQILHKGFEEIRDAYKDMIENNKSYDLLSENIKTKIGTFELESKWQTVKVLTDTITTLKQSTNNLIAIMSNRVSYEIYGLLRIYKDLCENILNIFVN